MGQDLVPTERPVSDQLHPGLYAIIACLVGVFVISAFAFGDAGYADYLLAVVAIFFVIAMSIPYLIWVTWRHHAPAHWTEVGSLREWSRGDYDTWQSRLTARQAAIQVLLPIAAVAFGMTAIGAVLLLVEYQIV